MSLVVGKKVNGQFVPEGRSIDYRTGPDGVLRPYDPAPELGPAIQQPFAPNQTSGGTAATAASMAGQPQYPSVNTMTPNYPQPGLGGIDFDAERQKLQARLVNQYGGPNSLAGGYLAGKSLDSLRQQMQANLVNQYGGPDSLAGSILGQAMTAAWNSNPGWAASHNQTTTGPPTSGPAIRPNYPAVPSLTTSRTQQQPVAAMGTQQMRSASPAASSFAADPLSSQQQSQASTLKSLMQIDAPAPRTQQAAQSQGSIPNLQTPATSGFSGALASNGGTNSWGVQQTPPGGYPGDGILNWLNPPAGRITPGTSRWDTPTTQPPSTTYRPPSVTPPPYQPPATQQPSVSPAQSLQDAYRGWDAAERSLAESRSLINRASQLPPAESGATAGTGTATTTSDPTVGSASDAIGAIGGAAGIGGYVGSLQSEIDEARSSGNFDLLDSLEYQLQYWSNRLLSQGQQHPPDLPPGESGATGTSHPSDLPPGETGATGTLPSGGTTPSGTGNTGGLGTIPSGTGSTGGSGGGGGGGSPGGGGGVPGGGSGGGGGNPFPPGTPIGGGRGGTGTPIFPGFPGGQGTGGTGTQPPQVGGPPQVPTTPVNPFSGGMFNPEALYNEYTQKYNEAKANNEQRYQDILSGYGSLLGQRGLIDTALLNNYQGRFDRNMGYVNSLGDSQRQEITDQYAKARGDATQSMISRGLGNTTVRDNVQAGLGLDERKSRIALEDMLNRERVGIDSALSGDLLNAQQRANDSSLALQNERLNFMERRSDTYPDLGMFLQLAQMAGQAGSGSLPAMSSLPTTGLGTTKQMRPVQGGYAVWNGMSWAGPYPDWGTAYNQMRS